MAEPLTGVELRVFRSLIEEWPWDSVEAIRVELTRGEAVGSEEIEGALAALKDKGYVEEFKPGSWQVAPNGHAVRRTLLGEMRDSALEDFWDFAVNSDLRKLGVHQMQLRLDERLDGEPVTRLRLLVDDPDGATWSRPIVNELRDQLSQRATEFGLPALSISLVPEGERDDINVR